MVCMCVWGGELNFQNFQCWEKKTHIENPDLFEGYGIFWCYSDKSGISRLRKSQVTNIFKTDHDERVLIIGDQGQLK